RPTECSRGSSTREVTRFPTARLERWAHAPHMRRRAARDFPPRRSGSRLMSTPGGETENRRVTKEPRDAAQFYLTAACPCPYLPGREERKVFTHLIGRRAAGLNDALTQSGFRRSQTIAYRPACESCRSCVSVRVVVDDFHPGRSLRRVAERNHD